MIKLKSIIVQNIKDKNDASASIKKTNSGASNGGTPLGGHGPASA